MQREVEEYAIMKLKSGEELEYLIDNFNKIELDEIGLDPISNDAKKEDPV